MLTLDTDHFSEIFRATPTGIALANRLEQVPDDVVLTIITAEEGARGWLAQISKSKSRQERQIAYDQFGIFLTAVADWTVLPWSAVAEDFFIALRALGVRIGTMDLRLASITLAHNAIVLTRISKDFNRVPGLRTDNWI
jgi:tRNA(fMet)-specific endonuclease VapC